MFAIFSNDDTKCRVYEISSKSKSVNYIFQQEAQFVEYNMGCEESKPQYFHLHPEMIYNHTQILTGEISQQSYPETIEQYCKSLAGLKFHGQKNRNKNVRMGQFFIY